ncbi:MAG: hypothetical protein A2Z72_06140 [Omnitrophica bacterium RBG_13_46_9]|nr:MAG: hypothetical protein A2Z72_06140 [Omnitrophica bacterium RBG_13_46_9]
MDFAAPQKKLKRRFVMWLKVFLSVILLLNLSGCAAHKSSVINAKEEQMQAKIDELENDLRLKDEDMSELEKELEKAKRTGGKEPRYSKNLNAPRGDMPSASPRQIQAALRNVGLYDGPIDGKIGKRTKKAIREFQNANGLTADGVVGKKTWLVLSGYLEPKVMR